MYLLAHYGSYRMVVLFDSLTQNAIIIINVPLSIGGSKRKQGYKPDVSLKRGIQMNCTLGK